MAPRRPASIRVAPGIQVDTVYEVADPLPGGLGQPPWDMDIDPLSGRLFIAQTIQDGGNILWLDLHSQEHGSLPFFSQALGFAADGTLYFGVSNFILGTWQRDDDVFLKFAIIPSVRGVVANETGALCCRKQFWPTGPVSRHRITRGSRRWLLRTKVVYITSHGRHRTAAQRHDLTPLQTN